MQSSIVCKELVSMLKFVDSSDGVNFKVNLFFNDSCGSIPSKLLKLPNVWKVDLSASNLSGKIPHSTFK